MVCQLCACLCASACLPACLFETDRHCQLIRLHNDGGGGIKREYGALVE
jgi:hypothetical protein